MSRPKCQECKNELKWLDYCKPCNSRHWRINFQNWTSGDAGIDKLIQESQLGANQYYQLLEWIEYSNLENIEHVAEGGFASVYKATWKDGPITCEEDKNKKRYYWDIKN